MTHPIPHAALDDRLGFIGTSGSGKTYNAGTAVEILVADRRRVVIIDPLGVWWGLRLLADGRQASPFNVVIFGGAHGDLPLTESAGALIGETSASMAESCIIDLSELKTRSAERRFMVAFLETIYRSVGGEPFHLIVDEADLFAPQKPQKGDETLLGHMENIVRRGRVKGFIPWLISQRPAVLNKNVLSQVDGLLAFKLTSSQDRDALDAWIEGQADKDQGKAIKASLPALKIGEGIVWLPGHAILETDSFPQKVTFDSSRRPKRGEKKQTKALQPIDIASLKERLSTVEQEAKANDPKALKAEIADLQRQLRTAPAASPETISAADARGYERARKESAAAISELRQAMEIAMKFIVEINAIDFFQAGGTGVDPAAIEKVIADATRRATQLLEERAESRNKELDRLRLEAQRIATRLKALLDEDVTIKVDVTHNQSFTVSPSAPKQVRPVASSPVNIESDALTGPQRRVVSALTFWSSIGDDSPTREQIAAVAGYSPGSGGFGNILGSLRTVGAIDYPAPGRVLLIDPTLSNGVLSASEARDAFIGVLSGPQKKVIAALLSSRSDHMTRDEIAVRTDYSASSGGFGNILGSLRTLSVVDYPGKGRVALAPWVRTVVGDEL